MYISFCVVVLCVDDYGGQSIALDSMELELQVGGCELPNMDAGYWTWIFRRANNHWVISQAPNNNILLLFSLFLLLYENGVTR